jgi:ribonuclease J
VTMMHSIPETQGLVIATPEGRFFHTADWKIEDRPVAGKPTDRARLADIGKAGIDAIICDSTNALRDGRSPSETDVAAEIAKIIKTAPRRVAVTLFSSNVARIQAVAEAAKKAGRHLVVAGRAIHRMIEVAVETGHLPKDLRYHDQDHFGYVQPSECVLLLTGSQGEPRAALARIADRSHPEIKLDPGDMVLFSSRTIPGNEKLVGYIQNRLIDQGCEVVTDNDALIHVTGHPRRDELKEMYSLIKPRIAVPMHGESRHLKAHAELAKAAGVPHVVRMRNGDVLKLAPGEPQIVDEAHTGRIFRDGRLLLPESEGSVRERRRLSEAGIAIVALAVTDRGNLAADPDVVLDGIPYEDEDGRDMADVAYDAIDGTLRSIPPKRRGEPAVIEDAVRRAVRSAIDQAWGKKPIVKVLVQVVGSRK